jgi:feruloyl-CoA synthase
VIAAADRDFVTTLVFPDVEACRQVAELSAGAKLDKVIAAKAAPTALRERPPALARFATGNSDRIVRIAVQTEPALLDTGEFTDKGSDSAKMVLERRASVVESLCGDLAEDAPDIIDVHDEFSAT